jgi:hypothetical protein
MSGTRFARGHRDGDPGKTIDSLTDDNGCRRLGIHVVHGNQDVVGIVVGDPDRHHIVPDSRGADQECQQKAEDDGGLTQFTHTPSQFRCGWFLVSDPRVAGRGCREMSAAMARVTLEISCRAAGRAAAMAQITARITVETPADAADIDCQLVWVRLPDKYQ